MSYAAELQSQFGPLHNRIADLRDENRRLREALKFYASEWQANGDGDSETPGLSRSWMEPTDELHNDEGRRARQALALTSQDRQT